MTAKKFLEFYEKLVEEEKKIFTLKGKEYSGDVNRFSNFERIAEELGLHPIEVLWVYATKHKDSISTYIKEKKVHSNEDIIGRIQDLRNYLALLAGLIIKCRDLPENHKWKLRKKGGKNALYKKRSKKSIR